MEKQTQDIIVTVDVAVFSLDENGILRILLPPRQNDPEALYPGVRALPGVWAQTYDRTADDTARRALKSKAGISLPYLEQLYTFSGDARDPRKWSISVAYYALVPWADLWAVSDDMIAVNKLPKLPFDHNDIIDLALSRLRSKSTYSPLLFHLLPEVFTLAAVQEVYEKVTGETTNRATFRRKMLSADYLEETGEKNSDGAHRPAALYRAKRPKKPRTKNSRQKPRYI